MLATRARTGLLLGIAGTLAASTAFAPRESAPPRPVTVEDILSASRAAHGNGVVRGSHMVAELEYESGLKALATIDVEPDHLRMFVMWPGGLDYILTVDGDAVVTDQGRIGGERDRRVVTGSERLQVLVESTIDRKSMFSSATLTGTTMFEGAPAYAIELTMPSGPTRMLYISQVTFLLLGEDRESITERTKWESPGPAHVSRYRTVLSDYREVSGVLVPFVERQVQDGHLEGVTTRAVSYVLDVEP